MKRIFFSFLFFSTIFWFSADSVLAQKSVGNDNGLPGYDQLKKEVAQLPDYVQELKRLRKSLQKIHSEFPFPFRTCVSKDDNYEKVAEALTGVLNDISFQRAKIAYVIIGIFSVNNVNAADYGWTPKQAADAAKWKKNMRSATSDIADINEIGPSDEAAEELLKNILDHISECNSLK